MVKNGNGGGAATRPRPPPKSRRPTTGAITRVSSAPAARINRNVVRNQPRQRMLPNGDIVVSHRELASSVLANGENFGLVLNDPINAGDPSLFPWLSGVAQKYESYVFTSLALEFRSQVPTTFSGSIYLTADYDARDAPPANEADMSVTPGSASSQVHQNVMMRCRAPDMAKRKTYYVRSVGDAVLSGSSPDVRSYDAGTFYAATSGVNNAAGTPHTGFIGQLWVHYTVRLMTPQKANLSQGLYVVKKWTTDPGTSGTIVDLASSGEKAATNVVVDNNLVTDWLPGVYPVVKNFKGTLLAMSRFLNKTNAGGLSGAFSPVIMKNNAPVSFPIKSYVSEAQRFGQAVGLVDVVPGDAIDVDWTYRYATSPGTSPFEMDTAFLSIPPNLKPMFSTILGAALSSSVGADQRFWWAAAGTKSAASPLGTAPSPIGHASIAPYNTTTGVLTVPPGEWLLTYNVKGTTLVVPLFAPAAGTVHTRSTTVNAAADESNSYVHMTCPVATTIDLSITSAVAVSDAFLWLSHCSNTEDTAGFVNLSV